MNASEPTPPGRELSDAELENLIGPAVAPRPSPARRAALLARLQNRLEENTFPEGILAALAVLLLAGGLLALAQPAESDLALLGGLMVGFNLLALPLAALTIIARRRSNHANLD